MSTCTVFRLPPGHDNGAIRVWSLDTGRATTLLQHTNSITFLGMALVHRNEELLVSAGYDGQVRKYTIHQYQHTIIDSLMMRQSHKLSHFTKLSGECWLGWAGEPVLMYVFFCFFE